MAGIVDLLSNSSDVALTPDGLRKLAEPQEPREAASEPAVYQVHRLSGRLGSEQVDTIVQRYEAGESATALAKEYRVAPSALLRLLRERNVIVRKHGVSLEQATRMVREYEAGATMAELEKKHQLSHGAVYRALHRAGLKTRASAPRRRSV